MQGVFTQYMVDNYWASTHHIW